MERKMEANREKICNIHKEYGSRSIAKTYAHSIARENLGLRAAIEIVKGVQNE